MTSVETKTTAIMSTNVMMKMTMTKMQMGLKMHE